jgi:hypothetical protein
MTVTAIPSVTSAWARATGRLILDLDISRVPEVFQLALARSPRFTIKDLQVNGATISTSMSAFSWGGTTTVQFSVLGPGQSVIDARSEPLMTTNILDFGQGKKDMTLLLTTIAATAAAL